MSFKYSKILVLMIYSQTLVGRDVFIDKGKVLLKIPAEGNIILQFPSPPESVNCQPSSIHFEQIKYTSTDEVEVYNNRLLMQIEPTKYRKIVCTFLLSKRYFTAYFIKRKNIKRTFFNFVTKNINENEETINESTIDEEMHFMKRLVTANRRNRFSNNILDLKDRYCSAYVRQNKNCSYGKQFEDGGWEIIYLTKSKNNLGWIIDIKTTNNISNDDLLINLSAKNILHAAVDGSGRVDDGMYVYTIIIVTKGNTNLEDIVGALDRYIARYNYD